MICNLWKTSVREQEFYKVEKLIIFVFACYTPPLRHEIFFRNQLLTFSDMFRLLRKWFCQMKYIYSCKIWKNISNFDNFSKSPNNNCFELSISETRKSGLQSCTTHRARHLFVRLSRFLTIPCMAFTTTVS